MAKHGKKKHAVRPGFVGAARVATAAALTPEADARRGLAAFERGEYGEAIQCWRRVRKDRSAPTLDRALAEAHVRRGLSSSPARRVQELEEAVTLAPERAVYHYHLGLAYHRQGQNRRALAAIEEAHRLAPADDRVRRHLAMLLLADPASAARARDLLAERSVASEPAVRLRALADLRRNDPAAAIDGLAGCKSPSPLATLTLGLAQLAAGQIDAARMALTRVARTRKPLGAEARQVAALATALVHLQAGSLDQARKVLARETPPAEPALRRAFAGVGRKLAIELLLAERLEESIAAWGWVVSAAPDDALAHRCQLHLREVAGMQAVQRGDYARAIAHWQAALVDQPNHGWLLRNLALAEERLERWSAAAEHWERVIRQWHKELRAAGDSDAAAQLNDRLGAAYRHLAGTHEAADNLRGAATALERALSLDSADVDLRLRAAELYLASEDAGHAIEHLRRVLPGRPNDTRVYLDLGSAYDLKGDDRQAQTYLEQALSLEPANPGIRATLASVHHGRAHRLDKVGLGARAVAELERALELAPADPEHPQCLGEVQLKLGHRDAAALAFGRVLALRPGDYRVRVTIGGSYLAHGDEKEAERFFRQALRLDRRLVAQLAIGLVYLSEKKKEQAETYFQRVLKGKEPNLLVLVGDALVNAGFLEEAIPYLERAASLDRWNAEAHLALAFAHAFGRHDHERAAVALDAAERAATVIGDPEVLASIALAREANDSYRGRELPAGGKRWSRG